MLDQFTTTWSNYCLAPLLEHLGDPRVDETMKLLIAVGADQAGSTQLTTSSEPSIFV